MADWLDLVVDARAIRAVYGEHTPDLSGIAVVDLVAQPDGRRVQVRFDLAEFPAIPPAKWVAAKNNTVQLTLSFESTEQVRFTGPITDDAADLVLTRENAGIAGELTAPSFSLTVRSEWLVLRKLAAYQQERSS